MESIERNEKKQKLVKPQSKTKKYKVQAYTTESGNPGCTQCQSGCYNCGCKTGCGSC